MRYCYLAGPITGQTYDSATDWRQQFEERVLGRWVPQPGGRSERRGGLKAKWGVLSPMRAKEEFRQDGPLPSTFDEGRAAVLRDLMDIRRSDVILVNLLGAERASIGTMCELGYAFAREKFILVVQDAETCPTLKPVKNRRASFSHAETLPPPGSQSYSYEHVDPHDHIFVTEMASQVVPTLDRALGILEHL